MVACAGLNVASSFAPNGGSFEKSNCADKWSEPIVPEKPCRVLGDAQTWATNDTFSPINPRGGCDNTDSECVAYDVPEVPDEYEYSPVSVPPIAPTAIAFVRVSQPEADIAADCDEDGRSDIADQGEGFTPEETLFVFDWDDTILPSTWVHCQGLRLDGDSFVSAKQRLQLNMVAEAAAETLCKAKRKGTVVFVTNAERGWIELSCNKFLPTLAPLIENIRLVSARTTFESFQNPSPLDWKLRAFETETRRAFEFDTENPDRRKNVLSFGDGAHEREALLRTAADLPNCHPKSLKFAERPDISQICKQHALVADSFDRIVHYESSLDLCIKCA